MLSELKRAQELVDRHFSRWGKEEKDSPAALVVAAFADERARIVARLRDEAKEQWGLDPDPEANDFAETVAWLDGVRHAADTIEREGGKT